MGQVHRGRLEATFGVYRSCKLIFDDLARTNDIAEHRDN